MELQNYQPIENLLEELNLLGKNLKIFLLK